jgi:hypothetical protein
MRGICWLAAKTGQLLKKDPAPWSKYYLPSHNDWAIQIQMFVWKDEIIINVEAFCSEDVKWI